MKKCRSTNCLILKTIYVPVFLRRSGISGAEETAKIRGGISNEWKVDGGVE